MEDSNLFHPHHVLEVSDLSERDIYNILELSGDKNPQPVLKGKGVALIFEHPSARTRNAAEMAVFQLGGHPITISGQEIGIDKRETAEDIARVLARFHSLIGARVTDHNVLTRMASAVDRSDKYVPIVNLLSDRDHVTQVLADLLTIKQRFGTIKDVNVTYIGDPNNVCSSLFHAAKIMGFGLAIAAPDKYLQKAVFIREAFQSSHNRDSEQLPGNMGASSHEIKWGFPLKSAENISIFDDPFLAVQNADVLYTDVFVSMGEEEIALEKRRDFKGYTIDKNLLEHAKKTSVVMHCLPAHRGEEISDEVFESPKSLVFDQAENRMHAMRGLFAYLIAGYGSTERS